MGTGEDGAHHFRCPPEGCHLKNKLNWSRYCHDEHSEKHLEQYKAGYVHQGKIATAMVDAALKAVDEMDESEFGPGSRPSKTRFKKIMRTTGKDGYEGMKSLLTDIVSEVVRKTLFGPS